MFDSRASNRFCHQPVHRFTSTKDYTKSCHNCTIVKPSDQDVVSSNMETSFRQSNLSHIMTRSRYLKTLPSMEGGSKATSEVKWGYMSAIDAEKRLLAYALLHFSIEELVASQSTSHVCISHAIKAQLVESFDELSSDGRGRYFHQMLPEIQLHQWRKVS
ncbi:hypothetical protein SADUNF_Sadunf03G0001600 [Salix dunnii]|uniref:Uncharacterized protein n=1 Tax=Salix dunnii TaxID=1413687 RepID=A0A835K863_9ROSI|nr:hypothetical protein SADUNF_Sadunf03G0001600 [Salix dunnii]